MSDSPLAADSAGAPSRRTAAIVAAVLLPPLGVYLVRGLGTPFWIALILTILAWLPGAAYALYEVLRR